MSVFVAVEIVTNGDSFITSSMRELAAVAVTMDGAIVDEYTVQLNEREGMSGDVQKIVKQSYGKSEFITSAIEKFQHWLANIESDFGKIEFVSRTASTTWPWIKYYCDMYGVLERPLVSACVCLTSKQQLFIPLCGLTTHKFAKQIIKWVKGVSTEGDPVLVNARFTARIHYCMESEIKQASSLVNT